MNTNPMQPRIDAMKRSQALGRCECSSPIAPFACPCRYMRDKHICHCGGEAHPEHNQEEWTKYNLDQLQRDQ